MKSSLLTLLGIALPVALMMVLWQYLASAPPPKKPLPANTGAQAPERRSNHGDPASLRFFQTQGQDPVNRPANAATWTDAVDGWLSQVERVARENSDVQRNAAAMLLRQGRFQAAAEGFDRLLVRDADDPVLLTGKAMALAAMNHHDDAIALFENAKRIDAGNPTTHYNYAVGLLRCGEREQAAQAFALLLETHPGHVKAMFNLAILHQAAGRSVQALEIWRRLTEGDVTIELGAPGQAPQAESATMSARMLADAWSHRGELALQQRELAEAEKCFLEVVELEPRNAAAWCNVGIARAEQVRRSDALTALQIALQLDPDLVPALNQAAYIHAANYRDVGNVEYGRAVIDYCRRSLRLKPDQPNMRELQQAARWFDREEREAAQP